MSFKKLAFMATVSAVLPFGGAYADTNHVDVYYVVTSDLEVSDPSVNIESDDGDGFGVKGRIHFTPEFFFAGEYQTNDYDGFNGASSVTADLDGLRFGVGYQTHSPFYGVVEFVSIDAEIRGPGFSESDDESGVGIHAGVRGDMNQFTGQAQVGYLDVGDFGDGFEFLVGGAFSITEAFGIFAEYRMTNLEEDVETDVSDVRVGARWNFGKR